MATVFGILLFGIGAIVTFANFTCSYLGYGVHRLRGGKPEDYRAPSGIALFGSGLLWASMLFLQDHPDLMWCAFIVALFDTAGIHWFAGTMLWMWWHNRNKAT